MGPGGGCSTLSQNDSLTQREDVAWATQESGRRWKQCRPGVRFVSRAEQGAQGCQGRNLGPQSLGVSADLAS